MSAGLRGLLEFPSVYGFWGGLVRGHGRATYVQHYVRPAPGEHILDLGCGLGSILGHLPPDVHYVGVDASERYIARATARYGDRAEFVRARVDRYLATRFSAFDLVMANGVIHHLDDPEASDLFAVARGALTPRGRLVTVDGCFVPDQSPVARFFLERDRGRFVRTRPGYESLARAAFPDVTVTLRHDLLRIPYTHLIMECRA